MQNDHIRKAKTHLSEVQFRNESARLLLIKNPDEGWSAHHKPPLHHPG